MRPCGLVATHTTGGFCVSRGAPTLEVMAWTNEDVARQFASIAALLRLSAADSFRVRAYERAATAIATAPADIGALDETELAQLAGVGKSTAAKITEYLETGSITMLEELREKVPPGLVEL